MIGESSRLLRREQGLRWMSVTDVYEVLRYMYVDVASTAVLVPETVLVRVGLPCCIQLLIYHLSKTAELR